MPVYTEREHLLISQVAAGYLAVAGLSLLMLLGFAFAPASPEMRRLVMLIVPLFLALAFCEIGLALLQSRFQPARYAALSLMRASVPGYRATLAWADGARTGSSWAPGSAILLCGMPILLRARHEIAWRDVDWQRIRQIGGYGLPSRGGRARRIHRVHRPVHHRMDARD